MTYQPTDYEQALEDWLAYVIPSDWVTVFANDNGPRPDSSYVLILVAADETLGRPDEKVLDEAYLQQFKGVQHSHFEGICSLNFFGQDARSVCRMVKRVKERPDVLELNHSAGLSLRRSEGTVDLTETQGTEAEPRFQFDQIFGWSDTDIYEAEVIESATATEV
jgi:hypothetical protein